MNIYEFAQKLSGRTEGDEITTSEEIDAKQLGFIVIFGYCDDGALLRGSIRATVDCYDGGTIYFDSEGLLKNDCYHNSCPYFKRLKQKAKTIKIIWGNGEYDWIYETEIPHATFDVIAIADGETKFCRGIVFDINFLKGDKGK